MELFVQLSLQCSNPAITYAEYSHQEFGDVLKNHPEWFIELFPAFVPPCVVFPIGDEPISAPHC